MEIGDWVLDVRGLVQDKQMVLGLRVFTME